MVRQTETARQRQRQRQTDRQTDRNRDRNVDKRNIEFGYIGFFLIRERRAKNRQTELKFENFNTQG